MSDATCFFQPLFGLTDLELFKLGVEESDIIAASYQRRQITRHNNQIMIEIIERAERRALELILPGCRSIPYFFRTLRDLNKFLDGRAGKHDVHPRTRDMWVELPSEVQEGVRIRAKELKSMYPYLDIGIKSMKEEAWRSPTDPVTSIAALVQFFRSIDDEGMVEFIIDMCEFLKIPVSDDAKKQVASYFQELLHI
jgi:hypothetical protein